MVKISDLVSARFFLATESKKTAALVIKPSAAVLPLSSFFVLLEKQGC
jgi:hypothetical protein